MPRKRPSKYKRRWLEWDGYSGHHYNPERALWLAVIEQAFTDLKKSKRAYANKSRWVKGEAEFYNCEAFNWFNDAGWKFRMVCDLAGQPPDKIRGMARNIMEGV